MLFLYFVLKIINKIAGMELDVAMLMKKSNLSQPQIAQLHLH